MAQICTALSAAVVGGETAESEYGDLLAVYPECDDVEIEDDDGIEPDYSSRPVLESAQ
jgi:hypothetical protein